MADSRAGDIFQPGDLLNNTYRIDSILGRGGTSEVYKARNDISGRFAAIKVLKSEFSGDEAFLTLMRREEEIREIRHDAVVRYSENHRTPEGLVYLVMDYVEGPGLDVILKQGGMAADDLVKVCRRVADGLRVAHARRIIHRDLSPDNIILKGGRPEEAVIIDFGIAKDANPGAQTIVGNEFAGKYAYAAPEQLAGHTDARSDLYALGALLLATFRGQRPDPGANPMEVVKRKQAPLDTSGVPEPLKGLIDRMSHPDPAQRFQSAEELLRAIDRGAAPALDDRTVVVRPTVAAEASAAPAAQRPATVAQEAPARRSRAGLWAVLVVVLAAAGAGGVWLSGAMNGVTAPALPQQEPYTLVIDRPAGGPAVATGFVPSEEIHSALQHAVEPTGGKADVTLASGAIGASWGKDVLSVVEALAPLDSWHVAIKGDQAAVTGATTDAAVQGKVMAAIGTLPGVLKGGAKIELVAKAPVAPPAAPAPTPVTPAPTPSPAPSPAPETPPTTAAATPPATPQPPAPAAPQPPPFLTAADVGAIMGQHADCGTLTLIDPPSLGYGKGDTIRISGNLSGTPSQIALSEAIKAAAPGREVDLQKVELLNPALCQIETTLPATHEGPLSFRFGFGDSGDDNPSGRYFVGENPVIDLVIPPEVTDGYLSVSIIDVSGNVYHLLPNLNRQDNAVADLRNGASGPVNVRIAYPLSDNKDPSHVAFTVDASSLGKSKVIVLHSEKPLFPELRPTTESVGGFADALKKEVDAGTLQLLSINSRILTSVAK